MKIQSTNISIKPIEQIGNKIFIRTNIERIETSDSVHWEYNEVETSASELLEKLLKEDTNNKLALTELFEMIIGGD